VRPGRRAGPHGERTPTAPRQEEIEAVLPRKTPSARETVALDILDGKLGAGVFDRHAMTLKRRAA